MQKGESMEAERRPLEEIFLDVCSRCVKMIVGLRIAKGRILRADRSLRAVRGGRRRAAVAAIYGRYREPETTWRPSGVTATAATQSV
jgi:hypothetical protein